MYPFPEPPAPTFGADYSGLDTIAWAVYGGVLIVYNGFYLAAVAQRSGGLLLNLMRQANRAWASKLMLQKVRARLRPRLQLPCRQGAPGRSAYPRQRGSEAARQRTAPRGAQRSGCRHWE